MMADYQLFEAATFVAPPLATRPRGGRHGGAPSGLAPKRLMLFAGRSNHDLAERIARRARAWSSAERHAEDVPERRDLRPLRRVDPRRRRVPRAVVHRARQRQPDGAADHGRRRASSARPSASPPSCRWYPYSRQDKKSAPREPITARLVADAAARRRRRPRADDGPARRPGAGLLRRPGRPHDRAADVRAVLPRPGPARRRGLVVVSADAGRTKLAKKFAEMLGGDAGDHHEGAPDAQRVAEVTDVIGDVSAAGSRSSPTT